MSTTGTSSNNAAPPDSVSTTVFSQCACGKLRIKAQTKAVAVATGTTTSSSTTTSLQRMDCHCEKCRKFHTSAFTSYLPIESYQILSTTTGKNPSPPTTTVYRDSCLGLAATATTDSGATTTTNEVSVDRLLCSHCFSKLLTTVVVDSATAEAEQPTTQFFLNMGPLVDRNPKTFPKSLLHLPHRSVGGPPIGWALARPRNQQQQDEDEQKEEENDTQEQDDVSNSSPSPEPFFAYGRCACGQTRYRILLNTLSQQSGGDDANEEDDDDKEDDSGGTELQHCYCRLCRQYSGSAFMTWMPAHYLEWIDSLERVTENPPPLIRTTPHGQRHFCPTCHACLTIVYDDQPDTIWPVAASLEDAASDLVSQNLYRAVHICCRYRPKWYTIPPNDGLPRLAEAS